MQKTWLIAGLGNPGPEYENTPHNLGFLSVDRLADRHQVRVSRKEAAALVGLGEIRGSPVVLAKPQTYMNVSGPSIKALLEKYELGPDNLLLVYDELALPWLSIRVRPKGSSAGHNGVESVIHSLGTGEFARVRLGIHPGHPIGDGARFVLAPMRRAQWNELDQLLDRAADAVESIIAEGVEKSMAKFNRRAQGTESEEQ
jgi:PTH1 family peptidyl-tRNA hydrolase